MLVEGVAAIALTEIIKSFASGAGGAAGEHVIKSVLASRQDFARKLQQRQKSLEHQIARLNAVFEGKFRVYHFRAGMPSVTYADAALHEPGLLDEIRRLRAEVCFPPQGENRSHAIAFEEDVETTELVRQIRATKTDYATVRALRATGAKPLVLSANALVFDPRHRALLLHYRSKNSATFGGRLHFFGGNFEPPSDVNRNDPTLHDCAARELFEETGLKIEVPTHALVCATQETATGFVQYSYAALALPKGAEVKLSGFAAEGQVEWHNFDALRNYARGVPFALHKNRARTSPSGEPLDTQMIDSCLGTIILWLLIGAPDQGFRTAWPGDAYKLGEEMLAACEQRKASA